MALELVLSSRFKKDAKLAKKRGYDMSELRVVLTKLCAEEPLEERYRDHALTNNYAGFRECHIRPNWLLVYAIDRGKLILTHRGRAPILTCSTSSWSWYNPR
jgi:mRNA interferase YafQ